MFGYSRSYLVPYRSKDYEMQAVNANTTIIFSLFDGDLLYLVLKISDIDQFHFVVMPHQNQLT